MLLLAAFELKLLRPAVACSTGSSGEVSSQSLVITVQGLADIKIFRLIFRVSYVIES